MSGIDRADSKSSGTYRAALAAVILLSVLLVLALVAVAAGFVRQYRIYSAGRQQGGRAAPADLPASIVLKPGAHIVSAGTATGKLVLHVETPQGPEVEIMDLASGKWTVIQESPK